jgi:hypothetical protein
MVNTKDPRKRKSYNLKYRYGITIEDYERELAEQDGRCSICLILENESKLPFVVDHDHACCPGYKSCGRCVRGVICAACNKAMGLLNDNVETAKRMVEYLYDMHSIRENRDNFPKIINDAVRAVNSIKF